MLWNLVLKLCGSLIGLNAFSKFQSLTGSFLSSKTISMRCGLWKLLLVVASYALYDVIALTQAHLQRWALRKIVRKLRNCAICVALYAFFFRSCAICVALYACFFSACAICVALYAFFFSACAICVCESVNLIFVAL